MTRKCENVCRTLILTLAINSWFAQIAVKLDMDRKITVEM